MGVDRTTFSNGDKIPIQHMSLNLFADFDKFKLTGSVVLEAIATESTEQIILDTRKLNIQKVFLIEKTKFVELDFKLEEHDPVFGSALIILLPRRITSGVQVRISIDYETAEGDECTALQWLSKEQTADKCHPFMFSQCQAIHARSMVPCMDSPGLKFTYDAAITVPAALTALMSAVRTGHYSCRPQVTLPDGSRGSMFTFQQKIPIPSYLIAICCGFVESREIGPRSLVWSEPSMIEACANEFDGTEEFIQIGEDLLGPYEWGSYDLLVLPPSFPYGGMENPCLTFVTPTLLAGDKSLVGVIAHEIAHSWTGNLVTNATWDEFWMNEGFTKLVERKIIARALRNKKAGFDLKAIIGYQGLIEAVDRYGHDHPFTCLHIDHNGVDPDDAFSVVSYEKGFNFLVYLENLVGGNSVFDPFLKAYIKKFRLSTVTPVEFRDFFESYMKANGVSHDVVHQVDWDKWLHSPGLPDIDNAFDRSLLIESEEVGKSWAKLDSNVQLSWSAADIEGWTTDMIVIALNRTIEAVKENSGFPDCGKMETAYGFSDIKNSEILYRWFMLCILSKYEEANQKAVEFITGQGRMKFVRPLYRQLYSTYPELAISTFKQHEVSYHPVCQKMIRRDLKIDS